MTGPTSLHAVVPPVAELPLRVQSAPQAKVTPEFTAYQQRVEVATQHVWPRLLPPVRQLITDHGGVSVIVAPTRRDCFNGFESLDDLYRGHEWPDTGEAEKQRAILDKRRAMWGPLGWLSLPLFKISIKLGQAKLWLARKLKSNDLEQHQADFDHQAAWVAFMTAKPYEESRTWSRLALMRLKVDSFKAIQPPGTPYVFMHPEDPHQWGDGQAITDDNDVPDRTVVHEVGHRFDDLGKKVTPNRQPFSKQPGFRKAVWDDVVDAQTTLARWSKHTPMLRDYAASILPSHPDDDAGMMETFAEGTAELQGQSSLWTGDRRIPALLFRRTHQYLQGMMAPLN